MNIHTSVSSYDHSAMASHGARHASRRSVQRRLRAALIGVDTAAILIALYFADTLCRLLPGNDLYRQSVPPGQWAVLGAVVIPVYLGAAANGHAFAGAILDLRDVGIIRSVRAMLLSIAVLTFIAFALKVGAEFSRLMVGIGSASAIMLLIYGRSRFLALAQMILDQVGSKTVLIIDGVVPALHGRYSRVIANPGWLFDGREDPRAYNRMANLLFDVDRVVISCGTDKRQMWAQMLKGANIRCEFMAPELEDLGPLGISRWDGCLTLVAAKAPIRGIDEVLKRVFDFVLSAVAVVVLAPLLIVVAIAIRVESPGPILFVQERIGIGNKVFRMYKFRSMRAQDSNNGGSCLTRRNDDRVTRVGRLIRSTSIDELPQLFNILKGEMSIVGPRPHALEAKAAAKLYWEVDRRYWHRHAVKPGLTGLAQVRGFRGTTTEESDLANRLQADLEYLDRWSLWHDILIILRTFGVIAHKNAF